VSSKRFTVTGSILGVVRAAKCAEPYNEGLTLSTAFEALHLEEVSTTCGSGWVDGRGRRDGQRIRKKGKQKKKKKNKRKKRYSKKRIKRYR
jgi:hypothetical protein